MSALVQQAALSLGTGATIAIAGQGVVQIYRGSGVLNFAHGAFALGSAQLFVWAWTDHGWPLLAAIALAIAAAGLMGLLTHLLVMRPLAAASPLVRIIATIGVMQVVQQGSLILFGAEPRSVGSFLPTGTVQLGSTAIPESSLVLLGVAVGLTLVLWATMTFSRFGLAVRATAENDVLGRSLGLSPGRIATLSWTLGGALAGLSGVMIVPIGGVAIASILLLAVPAFAAAVVGGFSSYPLTTVGALTIAAGQAILTYQTVAAGWPPGLAPALPFVVVVVVLAVRSKAVPARDEIAARLPRVASTPIPRWAPGVVLLAGAATLLASANLANSIITTAVTAIVGLSLVVVTGLAGQISLAQFAIAGMGALAAARVSEQLDWPFPLSLAVGVLAAACCGAVVALPALRTRGPALAVVTLGLGLAIQQTVLANITITGGFNGATPVRRPSLFGIDINAIEHPNRYAAVVVVAVAVTAGGIAVLRRGVLGRRMLAVRNNERAALAIGISVGRTKLVAFTVASAIAGLGGTLIAFRFDAVQYAQFDFFRSLEVLALALIGGVGFVMGPVIAAAAAPNGLIAWLGAGISEFDRWMVLTAGLVLIVTLIWLPDGIMATLSDAVARPTRPARPSGVGRRPASWPAAELAVSGLCISFGGAQVLHDVDLRVVPGTVTGLIGANGAGKTTLIDTVSGFSRPTSGTVLLGSVDLSRSSARDRAQAGVARCFQTIELFNDLTVRENLVVAAEATQHGRTRSSRRTDGVLALDETICWIVETLDIAALLDRRPGELSHGHRRLVGVARALATRPSVLLLDEPAAGLDASETVRLGEMIRGLADSGLGILLVEHDVDLVIRVSDHVVALDFGRTIYDGSPGGVLDDEAIRRAYVGEAAPGAVGPTRMAPEVIS